MMSNEGYQDRVLVCRDCGQDFTFSAGEQAFYASRGLTNSPGRCASCRAIRKSQQGGGPQQRPRTEMYPTICASCGRETTVPFIPREDRPVYCSDCYQAQRANRVPRQQDYSYNYGTSEESQGNNWGRNSNRGDNRGGRERRNNRSERDYSW